MMESQVATLTPRRISLPWFFVLLFVVSWIGAIPMVMASWTGTRPPLAIRLLQVLMLFGPGIVAIAVTRMKRRKDRCQKTTFRISSVARKCSLVSSGTGWSCYSVSDCAPSLRSARCDFLSACFAKIIARSFWNDVCRLLSPELGGDCLARLCASEIAVPMGSAES